MSSRTPIDGVDYDAPELPGVFRLLRPHEVGTYRAHLLRMSQADRRFRFAHAASDSVIESYVERLDWSRCVVLGCLARGVRRAAMQVAWPPSDASDRRPELAVEVEPSFRGAGVASALLAQSLRRARDRGFGRVTFVALAQNKAMIRLALRFGARIARSGSEVFGQFELRPALVADRSLAAFDPDMLHSW